jgi:tetratricopeptide (TPR) repeat protein
VPPDPPSLVTALDLVARAGEDPHDVWQRAEMLVTSHSADVEARVVGHRALALAGRALYGADTSVRHARRATQLARRANLRAREAESRVTLALSLFDVGRTRSALVELDRAAGVADDATLRELRHQRAILLERIGRLDAALEEYDRLLADDLDDRMRAMVLNNRGLARVYRGDVHGAQDDLDAAMSLFEQLGAVLYAALVEHNIGLCLAVGGDVPRALERFDQADRRCEALGAPITTHLEARAFALIDAQLFEEAREAAARCVHELLRTRAYAELPEARLLLARAELGGERWSAAATAARQARAGFLRQDRPALAAQAARVQIELRYRSGRLDRRVLAAARRCAEELIDAGLQDEAVSALLIAGLVARRLGQLDAARSLLGPVAAGRETGPLAGRLRGWYAEALLRVDAGRVRAARRAVRTGLDVLADLQAVAGASELRASLAGHGRELAEFGLRLAIQDTDPHQALEVLERWRGTGILLGRTTSASLTDELTELRAAKARLQEARRSGDDAAAVVAVVVSLEDRIRRTARHAPGIAERALTSFDRTTLAGMLDERALVEYFQLDGHFGAVVGAGGRLEMHWPLAAVDEASARIDAILFGLRRLSSPRTRRSAEAARASIEHGFSWLSEHLVRAVGAPLGHGGMLVVPTGPLHAVPWASLPAMAERSVVVSPSVRVWSARAATRSAGRVVLAAGPGLPGALAEIDRLAKAHATSETFGPEASLVDDVCRALEGASVAHLAAHGRLRTDNPLFSALELADGPLTVLDLERLVDPPHLVVLAACDVAASSVRAGDELLGVVAALLTVGTSTVVASLVPVPDVAAISYMERFHHELAAGVSPPDALRRARSVLDLDDPAGFVTAAAFTCYGAG